MTATRLTSKRLQEEQARAQQVERYANMSEADHNIYTQAMLAQVHDERSLEARRILTSLNFDLIALLRWNAFKHGPVPSVQVDPLIEYETGCIIVTADGEQIKLTLERLFKYPESPEQEAQRRMSEGEVAADKHLRWRLP